MKKLIILAMLCLLALTGCGGSNVDIISREQAETLTESELNAELIGKAHDDIRTVWGKPDVEDSELPIEEYYRTDGSIKITYDFYDNIEEVEFVDVSYDDLSSMLNILQATTKKFSYEKELDKYKSNTDGVIRNGFKNSEPDKDKEKTIKLLGEDHWARLCAEKEVTIKYNAMQFYNDSSSDMWCVEFYTKGAKSEVQKVYLDGRGVTQLIVYEK